MKIIWKNIKKRNIYQLFLIGFALVFFIGYFIYIWNACANVPIMDYWRYINLSVEKIFTNQFTLKDCFESAAGHLNVLNIFLLFCNIKLFHYDTRIEIIAGVFLNLLIALLLIKIMYKTIKGDSIYKYIASAMIIFYMFNPNKFEISTLQFSFAFSIRILCFILIFLFIDNKLKRRFRLSWDIVAFAIFFFFVVLTISGAYFAAMIISFGSSIILKLAFEKSADRKNIFFMGATFFILSLLAVLTYFSLMNPSGSNNANINIFKILEGTLLMLAGTVVHESLLASIGFVQTMMIGAAMLVGYIIAIVSYIRKKTYQQSWLPVMLIIYALISCFIISYGRSSAFDVTYLISSRYACETSLGIIGYIWILVLLKSNTENSFEKNVLNIVLVICIIVSIFSAKKEFNIGFHRKLYHLNLISMMNNIENYTDKELEAFQANAPEQVRLGVQLLKKYKLGVFKDLDNRKSSFLFNRKLNCYVGKGVYPDNWVTDESELYLETLDKGKIVFFGYYPYEITDNLKGKIVLDDGSQTEFEIHDNKFEIVVNGKPNSSFEVKIYCDFSKIANEKDIRKLSFILDKVLYE